MTDSLAEPRILIIEDNTVTGEILQDLLATACKSEPLLFPKGQEALKYLQDQCAKDPAGLPDLIILDLSLPDMKGLEILRTLKEHEKLGILPVIVYTGSDQLSDMLAVKKWGGVTYIKKGMGHKELGEAIERLKIKGILKTK